MEAMATILWLRPPCCFTIPTMPTGSKRVETLEAKQTQTTDIPPHPKSYTAPQPHCEVCQVVDKYSVLMRLTKLRDILLCRPALETEDIKDKKLGNPLLNHLPMRPSQQENVEMFISPSNYSSSRNLWSLTSRLKATVQTYFLSSL